MTMQLIIANKNYSSWSLRPWLLMKELAIPFEERVYPFGGDVPFTTFSPTGRVPCLVDGTTTVWDSLAIIEYLAEAHPGVWPSDRVARAFARSAAAEMHSGFGTLRTMCSMNCAVRVRLRETPPALTADLARIEALWADGLARFGGPFLAGATFTAVDAYYAPVAFRIQSYGLAVGPEALAYAQRLRELPHMRAWYAAGLAETWRDEPHEAEIRGYGDVVEDLRG
jgi:glutathione S-transferase